MQVKDVLTFDQGQVPAADLTVGVDECSCCRLGCTARFDDISSSQQGSHQFVIGHRVRALGDESHSGPGFRFDQALVVVLRGADVDVAGDGGVLAAEGGLTQQQVGHPAGGGGIPTRYFPGVVDTGIGRRMEEAAEADTCLLYTSDAADE